MSFATDIDAAVRRLERRGGVPSFGSVAPEQVTPELVKRYHRRAQELRAEAMRSLFAGLARLPRSLRRNLDDAFTRRLRVESEPTMSTVG